MSHNAASGPSCSRRWLNGKAGSTLMCTIVAQDVGLIEGKDLVLTHLAYLGNLYYYENMLQRC